MPSYSFIRPLTRSRSGFPTCTTHSREATSCAPPDNFYVDPNTSDDQRCRDSPLALAALAGTWHGYPGVFLVARRLTPEPVEQLHPLLSRKATDCAPYRWPKRCLWCQPVGSFIRWRLAQMGDTTSNLSCLDTFGAVVHPNSGGERGRESKHNLGLLNPLAVK